MSQANFEVEYDQTENHRMVIIYAHGRHRCGYVGVEKSHPLYGKDYDFPIKPENIENMKVNETDPIGTLGAAHKFHEDGTLPLSYIVEVHGGLTYAGGSTEYPVPSNLWWFGLDAAHFMDTEEGGRSLEYMVENCKKLSKFLSEYK